MKVGSLWFTHTYHIYIYTYLHWFLHGIEVFEQPECSFRACQPHHEICGLSPGKVPGQKVWWEGQGALSSAEAWHSPVLYFFESGSDRYWTRAAFAFSASSHAENVGSSVSPQWNPSKIDSIGGLRQSGDRIPNNSLQAVNRQCEYWGGCL